MRSRASVVPACGPLCSGAVSCICHAMPWATADAHSAAWVSLGVGSQSGCGLLSHIGTAPPQPALSLALGRARAWGVRVPLCASSYRAGCAVRDAHMWMRMRVCQTDAHAADPFLGSGLPYLESGFGPVFRLKSSVFGISIYYLGDFWRSKQPALPTRLGTGG